MTTLEHKVALGIVLVLVLLYVVIIWRTVVHYGDN